jgi:poly(3-hydroxybutyrate) depolymerase
MKVHYVQPGVGHYGVFNGSRFRSEIMPRISDFVLSNNGGKGGGTKRTPAKKTEAAH